MCDPCRSISKYDTCVAMGTNRFAQKTERLPLESHPHHTTVLFHGDWKTRLAWTRPEERPRPSSQGPGGAVVLRPLDDGPL